MGHLVLTSDKNYDICLMYYSMLILKYAYCSCLLFKKTVDSRGRNTYFYVFLCMSMYFYMFFYICMYCRKCIRYRVKAYNIGLAVTFHEDAYKSLEKVSIMYHMDHSKYCITSHSSRL